MSDIWKGKSWVVFFSIAILLGCGSQGGEEISKNEVKTTKVDSSQNQKKNLDTTKTKREFPILKSENAEGFLKQYFEENPERKVKLTTRLGTIKIRLFEDTPIHTANFLMLVKRDYFNNTEFTRIVENFVVQGGNNDKEQEEIKRLLIGRYELPPEILPKNIHKRGALAMARRYEENPEKNSSAYNFYLVQGQTFVEPQLMALERDHEIDIPEWKRNIYKTIGGAPHLDGEHTVFGEIYEGLDVLEKMSLVETDESEWPKKPLVMKIEVIDE